jgi:hypothetical protein
MIDSDIIVIFIPGMLLCIMGIYDIALINSLKKGTKTKGYIVDFRNVGRRGYVPMVDIGEGGKSLIFTAIDPSDHSKRNIGKYVTVYYDFNKRCDRVLISRGIRDYILTFILYFIPGLALLLSSFFMLNIRYSSDYGRSLSIDKLIHMLIPILIMTLFSSVIAFLYIHFYADPMYYGTKYDFEKVVETSRHDILDPLIKCNQGEEISDEILENAINVAKKIKRKIEFFDDFRDYVFRITDAYIVRQDYNQAGKWLKALNVNRLIRNSKRDFSDGLYVAEYYKRKIKICIGFADDIFLKKEMKKARPRLDYFDDKDNDVALMIKEIYYDYYFALGDFENARMWADNMSKMSFVSKNNIIVPDLLYAEASKMLGDIEICRDRLYIAEQKLGNEKISHYNYDNRKMYYDYKKRLLGRDT